MHRIYCPNSEFSSKQTFIDNKDELHHLRNVLRLKKSDKVNLFDGKGREAQGILLTISTKQATVQIDSVNTIKQKTPLITLACAIPKKIKFELIIEKATELGVDTIIPMKTERTEIKLNDLRQSKKQMRYQAVALSATRQSQRSIVPTIAPITDFSSALNQLTQTSSVIIPSLTDNTENLLDTLKKVKTDKKISFLIGPEGDFTADEYALAHNNGCLPVTLGETILRVETAAICALSCANLFFHSQ